MSGNGADIGQIISMLQLVINNQAEQGRWNAAMSRKVDDLDRKVGDLDRKVGDLDRKVGDLDRKVGDLDRKVGDLDRKVGDLGNQVSSLRHAVTEYHSSVIGHGILITELDERVRRIEHHLNLPPAA